jgi:sugar (pentulose or hexulose) kinase
MNDSQQKDTRSLVIGLDCSTTAAKAIAFDHSGHIVGRAHEPIPLSSPKPHQYEQDPNDWWISAQKALRRVTRHVDTSRISAIAISNQRETFVPLDKHGDCLRPAIVWLDERCKDEVEAFSKKVGQARIHRITGKPVDYAPVVYRLAWMKRHEPKLFRRIGMICDVQSYLVWKLTGAFKTSWASADPLGLFDLEKKRWSQVILDALRLNEELLPSAHAPGAMLGAVTRDAARTTGLRSGTLVIAGGGDGQAAGLGSNVLSPHRAYLNLGTAVVAGVFGKQYKTSPAFRTMSSCNDQGYYYECSLRAGTFAVDWLVREVLRINPARHPRIYQQLEQEAGHVEAGSDGLFHLPYMCGVMNPYWDAEARGAFVGLSSFHHRGHLYRSILEGIAFEQLLAINAVEKSVGMRVDEFAAIGGGSKSDLWCAILADVTGRNVCIPKTTEASALGAPIAAAVGAGWYSSFAGAARAMTSIKKTIRPAERNKRKYQKLFATYRKIYPSLKKLETSPFGVR